MIIEDDKVKPLLVIFAIVAVIWLFRNAIREEKEIPLRTPLEQMCETNPSHYECVKMRRYQDYEFEDSDVPPEF